MKKQAFLIVLLVLIAGLVYADERPRKQFQYPVTVTDSSTEIISENLKGRDIFIQNNDAAGIVYINMSGTATVSDTMIKITAGNAITIINTTNAIEAIGSIASNANVVVSEGL